MALAERRVCGKEYKHLKISYLMRKAFWFMLVIIFSVGTVSSWGASSPYWNERPLYLMPGEGVEVNLLLQNMVGGEDITFEVGVVSGGEIATLVSSEIEVLFGQKDVPVGLFVDIPSDYELGEVYDVRVSFSPLAEASESGNVGLSGRVLVSVPVIVGGVDLSPPVVWYKNPLVILAVLVVLGLVIYFFRRRKGTTSSLGRR